MAVIGFHASHEQAAPSTLLRDVRHAQEAGFDAAMCSDHLQPWSERQGHSGNAWAWLGAALQATSFPMGVVTAPGQRYHPAVHAQAIATLAELFPGRFWAALGSGEAMNEVVTGDGWPPKEVRDARLRECADVIRRLLRGEEVTHDGLVRVHGARAWSLPDEVPPLFAAAVSPETAASVREWADGVITVNQPVDALRRVLDAIGDTRPRMVQVHLSWADTDDEALAIAHDQWRTNVFSPPVPWDLPTPAHFDAAAEHVRPEDVARSVLVSADLGRHAAWLAELLDLGFDHVYLHHVGQEQAAFIDAFGDKVLPELR